MVKSTFSVKNLKKEKEKKERRNSVLLLKETGWLEEHVFFCGIFFYHVYSF